MEFIYFIPIIKKHRNSSRLNVQRVTKELKKAKKIVNSFAEHSKPIKKHEVELTEVGSI